MDEYSILVSAKVDDEAWLMEASCSRSDLITHEALDPVDGRHGTETVRTPRHGNDRTKRFKGLVSHQTRALARNTMRRISR